MPVYAGDVISYKSTVIAKRELATRPSWGLITNHNEGWNKAGELVASFECKVLVARAE